MMVMVIITSGNYVTETCTWNLISHIRSMWVFSMRKDVMHLAAAAKGKLLSQN